MVTVHLQEEDTECTSLNLLIRRAAGPRVPSDFSICHQSCLLNTVDKWNNASRLCFLRWMRRVGSLCSGLYNQDCHHQVGQLSGYRKRKSIALAFVAPWCHSLVIFLSPVAVSPAAA